MLLTEYVCFCSQEKGESTGDPTDVETFKIRRDKQQGNNKCVTVVVWIHVRTWVLPVKQYVDIC